MTAAAGSTSDACDAASPPQSLLEGLPLTVLAAVLEAVIQRSSPGSAVALALVRRPRTLAAMLLQ
jgi:hypothetical protein